MIFIWIGIGLRGLGLGLGYYRKTSKQCLSFDGKLGHHSNNECVPNNEVLSNHSIIRSNHGNVSMNIRGTLHMAAQEAKLKVQSTPLKWCILFGKRFMKRDEQLMNAVPELPYLSQWSSSCPLNEFSHITLIKEIYVASKALSVG